MPGGVLWFEFVGIGDGIMLLLGSDIDCMLFLAVPFVDDGAEDFVNKPVRNLGFLLLASDFGGEYKPEFFSSNLLGDTLST
jgi:hypothetical protein